MKLRKISPGIMFSRNPLIRGVCFLTLIITTTISLINGLAAGIFVSCATVMCLILRWFISKFLPEDSHLPIYLIGVCAVVSIGQIAASALYPDFASRMEIYLPITAVYCFADRGFDFGTKKLPSIAAYTFLQCLGFTICCAGVGLVREFTAFGTVLGVHIIKNYTKMPTMVLPVGGMITLSAILAFINYISRRGDKS